MNSQRQVKDKVVCPWCGGFVALRAGGLLNKHGFKNNFDGHLGHRPKPCEGSGRSPNLIEDSRPALRLRTGIG